MRTITITAVALVAALSARATGFDGLTLQTNDWFAASVNVKDVGSSIVRNSATNITKGAGSWTEVPSVGTATNATDGIEHFIALSAQDESLTFTPAPFAVTSGYETVVAQIKADAGDELPAFDGNPQAAFTAIVTNGQLRAFGLTANGWTNLVYNSVEALTNDWFTIYMDFANGENKTREVRYSVKPQGQAAATILTNETGASWFSTTYSPTITSISFSGVGKVQTFSGDELTEPISFSNVEITYLASYASATTVVATVSGTVASDTTFSMNFGESDYSGTYNSETKKVTFYNVGSDLNVGDTKTYTISSSGTYTTYSSDSQTTLVGTETGGWIAEDSSHSGSGTWSTNSVSISPLPYSDGKAALNNHLFTPTNAVGDAVVTVESQVCFGDVADPAVAAGPDSYAAIRLADVLGTTKFQIWAKETENADACWFNVSTGNDVNPETIYSVKSTFDFVNGTCSFKVGNIDLANDTTNVFYLANGVRKMSAIKFNGVGTLTQLSGSYVAAGYTEEVGTGTNVTVSSKWVAQNLSDKTVAEARELMSPNNRDEAALTPHGGSSFNYFECYALGIDPTKEEDAPIITATPDGTGKFGMKLEGINVPEGVTLTVTLQGSNSPSSEFTDLEKAKATAVGKSDGTTTTSGAIEFDPAKDMDGNVKYLKMDVSIGATP
jgi:hypothetical protein